MLKESYPQAEIGWAIDKELASAVEGHPALTYVHACNRKYWTRAIKTPSNWSVLQLEMSDFIDEIKAVNYDVAIDVQGLLKSAILPVAAGIKRRIGFGHGRECSNLFYTERHLTKADYWRGTTPHVEHMATLVRALGTQAAPYAVQSPVVSDRIKQPMDDLIKNSFARKAPLIALAPATQWRSKLWPEEHWVRLIDMVLTQTDFNLVLVGAKSDAPIISRIIQTFPNTTRNLRVLNLAGETSVQQMYALYSHVQAAVGSDSAPLHIAGTMHVPAVVGLYGPTASQRTPPLGSPNIKLLSTEGQLSCQPCRKKICPLGTTECMSLLKPDEVFNALMQALAEAKIATSK